MKRTQNEDVVREFNTVQSIVSMLWPAVQKKTICTRCTGTSLFSSMTSQEDCYIVISAKGTDTAQLASYQISFVLPRGLKYCDKLLQGIWKRVDTRRLVECVPLWRRQRRACLQRCRM